VATTFDLNRLAKELTDKLKERELSLRQAAEEVGCSPATLSRIAKGSEAETIPDTENLLRVLSWLGKSLGDFDSSRTPRASSLTDVEVHLRALQGLAEKDREALVAMVRAAHDVFKVRAKKS
jgi:transcriptional regulator with XRE-family HTH domain